MSSAAVRLSDLRAGTMARLHEARLDPDAVSLLRALGLTVACQLKLCKDGDPFIVQVRTTRIGLSRAVASGIYVIPHARSVA
jgi:Fe2+ transport system protein FeoA